MFFKFTVILNWERKLGNNFVRLLSHLLFLIKLTTTYSNKYLCIYLFCTTVLVSKFSNLFSSSFSLSAIHFRHYKWTLSSLLRSFSLFLPLLTVSYLMFCKTVIFPISAAKQECVTFCLVFCYNVYLVS